MAFYCDDLVVVHKDLGRLFDSIREKGFTIKETPYPDYFLREHFDIVKEP